MPRRRKGADYCPEIYTLLRDAQPRAEIGDKCDTRTPRERERARELAIGRLVKIYREAENRGRIDELDFCVHMFCEELKKRNQGQLPKAKGGRPTAEQRRLLIAVHLEEAIERRGKLRGSVKAALEEVAASDGVSYDHVSDIYKDRGPEFRRTVAVELVLRRRGFHKG